MAIGNFGKKNGRKRPIISDINITPFVDVLLVLLIIFMVAAPLMTSGVNIDLPDGTGNPINEKSPPIIVSVNLDGVIFLQEEQVKLASLNSQLLQLTGGNLGSKIFVQGDKKLDYGRVMEVVRSINAAGFNQVILVTELTQ